MLLVWFGLAWAGDGMLANYPYLWPLHAFLQPDFYLFWLNRIFLITAGLSTIIIERMLFGRSATRKRLGGKTLEAQ
jgi:hypothetical protein